jgi:predicted small secreted protein
MMKKTIVLASGLLVASALLLGACAEPNADQGAASGGSPSTTAAPSTTAPPPSSTAEMPRDRIKVLATGTVQQGVEPGCLVLDTGKGQRYVLLSKDASKLKPGAKVAVVGVRATGQASYCQQGTPLEVQSVRPAP